MEIDQHQLPIASLHSHTGNQKTPLDVGGTHRPAKGTGQADALRIIPYGMGSDGSQAPLDPPHRRQGNRHEGAFIIVSKRSVSGNGIGKRGKLIHTFGTGGVHIHLLDQPGVGIVLAQEVPDSLHIRFHDFLAGRIHHSTAIHKEVRITAKAGISHIPGIHRHGGAHGSALSALDEPIRCLHVLRLVFRNAQIGDQSCQCQHDNAKDRRKSDPCDFQNPFCHSTASLSDRIGLFDIIP